MNKRLKFLSLISTAALSIGAIVPITMSSINKTKQEQGNVITKKSNGVLIVEESTMKNHVSYVIAEINNFSNYSYGYGRVELWNKTTETKIGEAAAWPTPHQVINVKIELKEPIDLDNIEIKSLMRSDFRSTRLNHIFFYNTENEMISTANIGSRYDKTFSVQSKYQYENKYDFSRIDTAFILAQDIRNNPDYLLDYLEENYYFDNNESRDTIIEAFSSVVEKLNTLEIEGQYHFADLYKNKNQQAEQIYKELIDLKSTYNIQNKNLAPLQKIDFNIDDISNTYLVIDKARKDLEFDNMKNYLQRNYEINFSDSIINRLNTAYENIENLEVDGINHFKYLIKNKDRKAHQAYNIMSGLNKLDWFNQNTDADSIEIAKLKLQDLNYNETYMQSFYWDMKKSESDYTYDLYKEIYHSAKEWADVGINGLWMPPAYKGHVGVKDAGYGVYDIYDLGEFDQKGSVRTKYGNKTELKRAISALHENGIKAFADVVLNHMMGADETEEIKVDLMDGSNKNQVIEADKTIEGFTKYTFPGRGNKYSDFVWNQSHFDGLDWDNKNKQGGLYKIQGHDWDTPISNENGNFDYIMGTDLDFANPEVVNHLKDWGKWFVDTLDLDGFRIDAVKHIKYDFWNDWISHLRNETGKDFVSIGEYYDGNTNNVKDFLGYNKDVNMQAFDFGLHYNFAALQNANGNYDLSKIFDGTLLQADSSKAIKFVDNHDTDRDTSAEPGISTWLKPFAYNFILTRQEGRPMVFYKDFNDQVKPYDSSELSMSQLIKQMTKARKYAAYGIQKDNLYQANKDLIWWVSEGNDDFKDSSLVSLFSDRNNEEAYINVGARNANTTYVDILGNIKEEITTDENGNATFKVMGGKTSLYVKKEAYWL